VSRSAPALNPWSNVSLFEGNLVAAVTDVSPEQDVVVVGSTSVVHALSTVDVVDEYRVLLGRDGDIRSDRNHEGD